MHWLLLVILKFSKSSHDRKFQIALDVAVGSRAVGSSLSLMPLDGNTWHGCALGVKIFLFDSGSSSSELSTRESGPSSSLLSQSSSSATAMVCFGGVGEDKEVEIDGDEVGLENDGDGRGAEDFAESWVPGT